MLSNQIVKKSISNIESRDGNFDLFVDEERSIILKIENKIFLRIVDIEKRFQLGKNTLYKAVNNLFVEGAIDEFQDVFKPTSGKYVESLKKLKINARGNIPIFINLTSIKMAILTIPNDLNGNVPIIKRKMQEYIKFLIDVYETPRLSEFEYVNGKLSEDEEIMFNKEQRRLLLKETPKNELDKLKRVRAKTLPLALKGKPVVFSAKESLEYVDTKTDELVKHYVAEYKRLSKRYPNKEIEGN
jgi:hypothetical protein